ncbi:MAG: hypothetical protein K6G43_00230 [Lachnospiraceae bacterium]|nr:hypothetical protein [Lachnospiraceae bacterium]
MRSIKEYNFRDIIGRYFILRLTGKDGRAKGDKFLAYCYIDPIRGISFYFVANLTQDEWIDDDAYEHIYRNKILHLHYHNDLKLEVYQDQITDKMNRLSAMIDESVHYSFLDRIRSITEFDPYRNIAFPDDLMLPVLLTQDGKEIVEKNWIRMVPVKEGEKLIGLTVKRGEKIRYNTKLYVEPYDGIDGYAYAGFVVGKTEENSHV